MTEFSLKIFFKNSEIKPIMPKFILLSTFVFLCFPSCFSLNSTSAIMAERIRLLQFKLYRSLHREVGVVDKVVFQTECSHKGCVNGHWIPRETILKECPFGWRKFKYNCYFVSHESATWFEAECKREGSYLVTITTREENEWIQTWLRSTGRRLSYWIGANSMAKAGTFTWSQSGSPLKFTDFYSRQPDSPNTERCLDLPKKFNYKWNDMVCDGSRGFICEK